MKFKGWFCCLVALMALSGCAKPVELPAASEPPVVTEPAVIPEAPAVEMPAPEVTLPVSMPDAHDVYIFSNDAHSVVVSPQGELLMDNADGTLETLRDNATGRITGLMIQRQEGFRTDEWGGVYPLRQWCDLYDLEGNFEMEVPLSYVSSYGDFLYGYNQDTMKSALYSRSTGQLLYDDVMLFAPLGAHYFVSTDVWGSPGTILTAQGAPVAQTPREYAINSVLAARFLVTEQNGLCGLLDENGQEVLPCRYPEICSAVGDLVQVRDSDMTYQILDLTTGETVFRWAHPIEWILPEAMVVQIDDQFSGCMLVSWDGTPLMDDHFGWISAASLDENGTPTLLCGSRYGDLGTENTYFTPDGTVVRVLPPDRGFGQLISDDTLVLSRSQWDEETQISTGTVELLNIRTGELLFQAEGNSVSAMPMFANIMTGEGQEDGYIILNSANDQGWLRNAVVHESGQVVLEDCQNLRYVGGGVVQCTKGFTSGLMRLDGTWLYEEPAFSSFNEQ